MTPAQQQKRPPEEIAAKLLKLVADWRDEQAQHLYLTPIMNLVEAVYDLAVQETRQQDAQDTQLIADVLEEYAEADKEAGDNCDDCGPVFMCRFHSVLSALARRTMTTQAIQRADAKVAASLQAGVPRSPREEK
jgi:hypothetical protein